MATVTADQEPDPGLSISSNASRVSPPSTPFRFLDLPLELRLKIYTYLLPARAHTIATQIPHNGYFFNTASLPSHSASSFYPFGRSMTQNLTTYKVLTDNFRSGYPSPSIHPEILRVSKQLHGEAEPVLYAANGALWDFGVHLDALLAFWGDRSQAARACVRNIRIAREIPTLGASNSNSNVSVDAHWLKLCTFIKNELVGLKELDLTVWSGSGSVASFPAFDVSGGNGGEEERLREWEWTKELLDMDALRCARVTWWGFKSVEGEGTAAAGFDSWMAGRMVADKLARDRMVKQGLVVEGSLVVSGRAT
ncbi:hypothetical protein LARI1_G004068 [Lachnellula arida]|uniref:F-box domain-containing protein n=1 Tax=Lachnellula arida TaxID=1316785 RepID=A0A8T9BFE7_9HELO|nr:hypothetical protein LARI1_G004068 [Lachnellula arida]